VKAIIKSLLPDQILAAIRVLRSRSFAAADPYAVKCYGQEGEDMVIDSVIRRATPGFYVDVGAHHPQRFSNTYMFYKRGWRGINIEPNPIIIDEFRRKRPRDTNLSMGISDVAGEMTYLMFDEPAVNTFSEAHASRVEAESEYRVIERRPIRVQRLDQVLSTYLPKGQPIDFLSVDVEGYDFKVLSSNDWTTFRPRCVVVEAYKLSFDTISSSPVHGLLTGYGYKLHAKTANTLIYEDSVL
jgi:FkbM family methyltransferase